MDSQDFLAKIKLARERLAKALKRSLVRIRGVASRAWLWLGPRLVAARQHAREIWARAAAALQPGWTRICARLAAFMQKMPARRANLRRIVLAGKKAWAGAAGGAGLLLFLLWAFWPRPGNPYLAFEEARLALSEARQAEAKVYTPKLLQMAESRWQSALISWHLENQRWRFRRDYEDVIASAGVAAALARQATTQAVAIRDSLQWLSATGITLVKDKIDSFKAQFNHVPVQTALRKKFLAGELAILESELAFNRRDYLRAAAKYQQAAADVGSADAQASNAMRVYLANLPRWRNWAAETIEWSKQEQEIAIVVDKMAARAQVYKAGVLQAEYPVELGPRWVGHKRHRGDGATPEGRYQVIRKKEGKRTIYYKALEINYPNETDREAFEAAITRGELPRGTHIGGLIEIHGEGGKGANWTAGCVALRNPHMDEVFGLAKVGTPVTIVGSLKGMAAREMKTNGVANSANGAASRKKS